MTADKRGAWLQNKQGEGKRVKNGDEKLGYAYYWQFTHAHSI